MSTTDDETSRLDRIYETLVDDEDARVCKEIGDEACRVVPGNFFRYAASITLTKLGDALISPKTTLSWVVSAVGAPEALVSLLVPIRESGSLLPQIAIAGRVRRLEIRKWVWVLGSILQALAIAGIAAAAAFLEGTAAGWAIVAALAAFSLSRGLSSVASKDVKGKTIPKTRRGQATGLASSVSGVLTLGVALWLFFYRGEDPSPIFYGSLLAVAAILWLAAAAVFSRIEESPGATDGGGNTLAEALGSLSLLVDDAPFRRFVLTRSLLVSTALAGPYYVLLAREKAGGELSLLALFILANGLASSLSAMVWGRWADRSSRRVLVAAAALASTLAAGVFAIAQTLPEISSSPWTYAGAFFVLGFAHSGVRAGRKTYLVDMAEGNKRTDYVAVSNTAIGVVLLASVALAPLVEPLGPAGVLLLLALLGFAGAALGLGLPEVET